MDRLRRIRVSEQQKKLERANAILAQHQVPKRTPQEKIQILDKIARIRKTLNERNQRKN